MSSTTPPRQHRGVHALKEIMRIAHSHDAEAMVITLLANKLAKSDTAPSNSADKLTGAEHAYFQGALDLARLQKDYK